MAALKSTVPIAHVESGLRSNDRKTVEEHNRRIVDHISDILFSPTETSTKNLKDEHVYGQVHTVGNMVIDAISLCLDDQKGHYEPYGNDDHTGSQQVEPTSSGIDNESYFVLVTMHRSENVDGPGNLSQIIYALSDSKLTFIFPMHPHTLKKIREYGLTKDIGEKNKNSLPAWLP